MISEISDARQSAKHANRFFCVVVNEGKQRRDPALLHDDFATGLQSGETREKRDAELLDVERNVLDANEFEDDGDDVEGIKQTTDVDWRSGRNKRERSTVFAGEDEEVEKGNERFGGDRDELNDENGEMDDLMGDDFFVNALIHRCDGRQERKVLSFAFIRML